MTAPTEPKPSRSHFWDCVQKMETLPQPGKDNSNRRFPPYTAGEGWQEGTEMEATDPEKKPFDLPFRGGRGEAAPQGEMRDGGCGGPHSRGRGRGRGLGIWHHAHMASHNHNNGNDAPALGLSAFLERPGPRPRPYSNVFSNTYNEAEQKGPNGFVPNADIFDIPGRYMVHVSLPGAKKENVNVDYMPAVSVLHISGTVNRPPGSQHKQMDGPFGGPVGGLVVGGREREIGRFARNINLGTRLNPAHIAVDRISSKLEDGVLIVLLPKKDVDPSLLMKRVFIEGPEKEGENDEKRDNISNRKANVMTYESMNSMGPYKTADDRMMYIRADGRRARDYKVMPVVDSETEAEKDGKKNNVCDKKTNIMNFEQTNDIYNLPYKRQVGRQACRSAVGSMIYDYKEKPVVNSETETKEMNFMTYEQTSDIHNMSNVMNYKRQDDRQADMKLGDGMGCECKETPVADSETEAEKVSNDKEDDLLHDDHSRSDSDEKEYVTVNME